MGHYFALRLASHFYYGEELGKRKITAVVLTHKVIPHAKIKNYSSLGLNSENYFTLPQMLAFDFYMSANVAFPEFKTGTYRSMMVNTLREACARISALPESGWDIGKYKIVMMKPKGSLGFFVTMGTHFESFGNFNIVTHRKLCYTGKEFLQRLKEIHTNANVYKQVRDTDNFWNIKRYEERTGFVCQARD